MTDKEKEENHAASEQEENSANDKQKFSNKDIFKIALKARDFEIKMFWQRCNYFLLLNTSVGVGAGTAAALDNALAFLGFCAIGMFVCFAWIKVGLGAKFWQSHWGKVVDKMQKKVGLSRNRNFFSDHENIYKRVEQGLKERREKEGMCLSLLRIFPFFPCFYNKRVLAKPSVSGWMHKTACFFFWVWLVAAVYVLLCFACWDNADCCEGKGWLCRLVTISFGF